MQLLFILLAVGFFLSIARGEAGKFICQLCFPFCLLAFLLILCGYYEANLRFGLEWNAWVTALLTIGFGFGAFEPARSK
jgi:hypothetical protein